MELVKGNYMNFLWKILLIAIVSLTTDISGVQLPAPPVAAAAVGGNVLDFDTIANINDNIPAIFQPKIYHPAGYQAGGPNNLKYVYFTIFNPGEVEDGRFMRTVRRNPNLDDNNIYFPADGSQPTTPDAVNYSLANIDNRENSPITEWYMMMFGVIPINHAAIAAAGGVGAPAPIYVQAGWSPPAPGGGAINAQSIISFHASVDNTMVNDPNIPGANISRRALFEREFRKIASTSVGRVLLYRILIEIRRHQSGNNVGCLGNDVIPTFTTNMHTRNKNRRISIYMGIRSSYNSGRQKITIRQINKSHTIIGKITAHNDDGYATIGKSESSIDISLFHEMTHWYHVLRNPTRQAYETSSFDNNNLNLRNYYLGSYYWSGLDNCVTKWNADRRRISESHWGNFEEMRTILGVPYGGTVHQYNTYREGDDLSENLYRICIGSPIRFGYGNEGFYEDRKVINKVLNAVNESHTFYIKNYTSPSFIFNALGRRNGLGNCKK